LNKPPTYNYAISEQLIFKDLTNTNTHACAPAENLAEEQQLETIKNQKTRAMRRSRESQRSADGVRSIVWAPY